MNRFGRLADELTDMIEEMERPEYIPDTTALVRALQRAFTQACLADRKVRLQREEAEAAEVMIPIKAAA